ncbi:MAG: hypothetical protein WCW13_02070 [archaeon]|jgi:hypothetical protein
MHNGVVVKSNGVVVKRKTLRDVRLALREHLKKKYRLKRAPRVNLGGKIKGVVFYKNPEAIKVVSNQKYFTNENIQWVSKDSPLFTNQGHALVPLQSSWDICYGKVKFCGVPNPKRVIIKMHLKDAYPKNSRHTAEVLALDIEEIIKKLRKGNIPHAKMGLMDIPHSALNPNGMILILMEPFVRTQKGAVDRVITKLDSSDDIVRSLDLRTDFGVKVFTQIASITSQLAKQGLYLENHRIDKHKTPFLGAFNYFLDHKGEPKVIVQDLESITIAKGSARHTSPEANWGRSVEALLKTIPLLVHENLSLARAILATEARKNHVAK